MTRRSATQSPGLEPSGSPCVSTASPREKSGEAQGYLSERVTWRLGRYQDVLADVTCDAVIADPPYGHRTHASVGTLRDPSKAKISIEYPHWAADDVVAFVNFWSTRCRGWMVALTSHDLIPAWTEAYESTGRYSFAPVPCVMRGMSIRLQGDGPSGWAVYAMVARPKKRAFAQWGTLDGAYTGGHPVGGSGRGKPIDLMRAIVRDYSRPGDLVCDPCGGLATTGVAALSMGRKFVGAEMDAETHAKGLERLRGVVPVDLFDTTRATQSGLDLGLAPVVKLKPATPKKTSKRLKQIERLEMEPMEASR